MKKSVFRGRIIEVNIESVKLPNGNELELEMVQHPGGAAVVAIDEEQRICLLHQYRHVAGGYLWELPAGKIDNNEPPLQTAQRELEEEGGRRARTWDPLGDYLSSPGIFTEVVHLYLARDLEVVRGEPEEEEVFEVHWRPLTEAVHMAATGEIRDGKSVVGIFRAAQRLTELI